MIISEEERQAFAELFGYIYKDNEEAAKLSFEILDTLHIWDDLYDKDKEVSPETVNYAFFNAMYKLQKNVIWQHCNLGEHMLNVILRWQDANVLEREQETEDDLHKAYMLRAGLYDLFVIIAYHLHGMAWAATIGPDVRRFYCETLKDFKEEMAHA